MSTRATFPAVRALPEDVANKIAAGEVVERPASVVKELVENALDARASRIQVRLVAAGRRTIEVQDNGHGMSEQDALLAIERHTTSKIRKADDLDNIVTLGFRGEALASIAAVSRFELVTRRSKDEEATRLRVEGGILRDVGKTPAPVGTRISVNRLYFNTPVRAKFLKGITTELSQCIDVVQRHALAATGVGFQLFHNEKLLLDIPDRATLRERAALIWGLTFLKDLIEINLDQSGFRIHGLIGAPQLTRSSRSHQFFFINARPIVSRSLQYGFEDGYRELITIGRHPVGIVMIDVHPRLVDVNIHPSKREVRFRDERAIRDMVREAVRNRLAGIFEPVPEADQLPSPPARNVEPFPVRSNAHVESVVSIETRIPSFEAVPAGNDADSSSFLADHAEPIQTEFGGVTRVEPSPVYRPLDQFGDSPMQLFDTYLLVPEDDRLLIIDQHALHERITYDQLREDLGDHDYHAQQLAVPLLVETPPSHTRLLETNLPLFGRLGIEIESFGGNTFQVTAVCHLYAESKVPDAIYRVLDALAQGDLFSREEFMADLLRLTVEACRSSVKAGDRLTQQERKQLLDGFRKLRPPYTCPHGRPIITELTQLQMEKSFRRRQ